MPNPRNLMAGALPVILLGSAAWLDLAKPLGAHPWWSQKIIWIGLPIGLVLAFLAHFLLTKPLRILSFLGLTAVAVGIAHYGKTTFAASFAENALAGHLWFFGWIGAWAGCSALIAALVAR